MAEAVMQKGSKAETFGHLVKQFNMHEDCLALFMASEIETLEDFRFFFSEEKEIEVFVAKGTDNVKESRLQMSRMKQAWHSVKLTASRMESGSTIQASADLDDLLCEVTLREVKYNFWLRHKLVYPTEIWPCDQLVSRCYRELHRRMLQVYPIWTVKNLMHQVTTNKKRKAVGHELYIMEDEQEVNPARSVHNYLDLLHTYLLAMAVAGSNKLTTAPAEETLGTDQTKVVNAPWPLLEGYYFRARRTALRVPEPYRLAWLEKTDIAERAAWVAEFRGTLDSLGTVVQTLFDRRAAHWEVPVMPQMTPRTPPPPNMLALTDAPAKRPRGQRRKEQGKGGGKGGGKKGGGRPTPPPRNGPPPGSTAQKLKDGKALCGDFQRNTCQIPKGTNCPKGLHRCGKVLPSGRICGMSNHGASECRNR